MEKKTTQRTIGVLVVIALGVILVPLLFDKNEAATKTSAVVAPPFPDQAGQQTVASTDSSTALPTVDASNSMDIPPELADKINQTEEASAASQPSVAAPLPSIAPVAAETPVAAEAPAPVISKDPVVTPKPTEAAQTPAVTPIAALETDNSSQVKDTVSIKEPISEPLAATQVQDNVAIQEPVTEPVAAAPTPIVEKIIKAVDSEPVVTRSPKKVKARMANATSSKKIVDSAWAIQIGSFKNKENARQLTNKLRAAGFKAFTQQVASQTRVYVGPEEQQASAIKLSTKLKQTMQLNGLVVSYKPLSV